MAGTDTGVGKTLVAGAIAQQLARSGQRVGVFKPIASGCERRREGLVSGDAEFLAHWSNCGCPLELINPIRYHEPLAPLMAAEQSGRPVDWEQMRLAYRNVAEASDVMVVEGIGGVMVPIDRDRMVLDLMVEMGLGVVIVARSSLGTINHTLLTVEACRNRGLRMVGIVINGYRAEGGELAEESNPRVIAEVSGLAVLTIIPWDEGSCVEQGMLGADVVSAVGLVDWGGNNYLDRSRRID